MAKIEYDISGEINFEPSQNLIHYVPVIVRFSALDRFTAL